MSYVEDAITYIRSLDHFSAIAALWVAAFLLAMWNRAAARPARKPLQHAPANVIPFRRPVDYEAYDLHRYRRMPPAE